MIRQEVYTRGNFASLKYNELIVSMAKAIRYNGCFINGNILVAMHKKMAQAHRIYWHYFNEFQSHKSMVHVNKLVRQHTDRANNIQP